MPHWLLLIMDSALALTRERLLPLVSRSFALCIQLLPKKVKPQVGNFYLLCRYADTIEDSLLPNAKKKGCFKQLLFCIKKNDSEGIAALGQKILPAIEKGQDGELIRSAEHVLREFNSFGENDRKIGLHWLTEMCRGMEKFSKKNIDSFADLDEYCYFVAGTVGLYLTELFISAYNIPNHAEMMDKAKNFGLLLQKVNIIRDFSHDYKDGRVFWPVKVFQKHNVPVASVLASKETAGARMGALQDMVSDARRHVKYAHEYIAMLPDAQLKMAWSIPLLMALPTLDLCENNEAIFDSGATVKIDRGRTATIIEGLRKEYQF